MKRIMFIISLAIVLTFSAAAYAEETTAQTTTVQTTAAPTATPEPTTAPTATPAPTATTAPTATPVPTTAPSSSPAPSASPAPTAAPAAGITPDSPLYFLDKMVESVQVTFTFSADGKAELLVSFANERLAEADIMTAESKQELFLKVMDMYVETIREANEKAEEAAQQDKEVNALLESISITTDAAGKTVIKANGVIPQESAEELKQAINVEVSKTIVVNAASIVKTEVEEAKEQVKLLKEAFEAAKDTGDEAAIKAAEEKLKQALEALAGMEDLKDEVNEYKEAVIKDLKEETDADEDSDNEVYKEKVEKKIAKMEEIIKKQLAKREEIIAKVQGKGKASGKIKANTDKQIERKLKVINSLKESIGEGEEETTAQVTETAAVTVETSTASVNTEKDTVEEADKDKKSNGKGLGLGKLKKDKK